MWHYLPMVLAFGMWTWLEGSLWHPCHAIAAIIKWIQERICSHGKNVLVELRV